MTFLPIVERELRVAARRVTTRWTRFALTAVVSLIVVNCFTSSGAASLTTVGESAFQWLTSAAFILGCAACTLTADALSAERREGTLGLLFLTDLRPWDITLGKLASAGLGAAYAGIAFVPLLMLPLLAGGVTGLEALRTSLALLTILLFALAAGLAASAREVDRVRALRRAVLWVFGTTILPALATWFGPAVARISLISPLMTLLLARDTAYRTAPMNFWFSLTIQLVHAATLLCWAGRRLRRGLVASILQPRPAQQSESHESIPYSSEQFSNASYLAVNPPRPPKPKRSRPFDEARPLEWLVKRQRGQSALCWSAAVFVMASSQIWVLPELFRIIGRSSSPLAWYLLYHLSWIGEALLAWAATRFFFESRRSGELELLLTTPVGAGALISQHWAAMKRLLRGPMVLVFAPFVLQIGMALLLPIRGLPVNASGYQLYSRLYPICHALELMLIGWAAIYLGVWCGLTVRRLFTAVALTVALAAGLPLMIHTVWQLAFPLFFNTNRSFTTGRVIWMLGCYPIVYALLLAMIVWVHRRLRSGWLGESMQADWWQHIPGVIRQSVGRLRVFRPH